MVSFNKYADVFKFPAKVLLQVKRSNYKISLHQSITMLSPADLPVRQHAGISFTQRFKNGVFAPQRQYVAQTNAKRATFYAYQCRNVGLQPRNRQNVEFCPQICVWKENCFHDFNEILSIYTQLQVSFSIM